MVEGAFALLGALVSIFVGFKIMKTGGSFFVGMVGMAVLWTVVGFVLGVWR